MKLGEALTLRKKQAEKLNELRTRIQTNALVQEGDAAQEDVHKLVGEYAALSAEHRDLVLKINKTNQETVTTHNTAQRTLAQLIAERENLIRQRNLYITTAEAATVTGRDLYNRYSRTEIKYVPQINVPDFRATADDLAQQVTKIDVKIQSINWETDLV